MKQTIVAVAVGVFVALVCFCLLLFFSGVLVGFFAPTFTNAPSNAKIGLAELQTDRNGSLPSALRMYRMAMGRYPTTDEGLKALIERPVDARPAVWPVSAWGLKALIERPVDAEQAKAWMRGGGPFIEDVNGLKDPWGNEYRYSCPGRYNTEGFDLWSVGPDGQEGTDDDIVNWKKG